MQRHRQKEAEELSRRIKKHNHSSLSFLYISFHAFSGSPILFFKATSFLIDPVWFLRKWSRSLSFS